MNELAGRLMRKGGVFRSFPFVFDFVSRLAKVDVPCVALHCSCAHIAIAKQARPRIRSFRGPLYDQAGTLQRCVSRQTNSVAMELTVERDNGGLWKRYFSAQCSVELYISP